MTDLVQLCKQYPEVKELQLERDSLLKKDLYRQYSLPSDIDAKPNITNKVEALIDASGNILEVGSFPFLHYGKDGKQTQIDNMPQYWGANGNKAYPGRYMESNVGC